MAKLVQTASLRMRLAFALLAALTIAIVLESVPALRGMVLPLQQFTALLAFTTIKASGVPIAIDDILLSHPNGFRVAISYGCTPIVPVIFIGLIVTIGLALCRRERIIAIATGIAMLTFLNLFRVVVLYYIGVYSPTTFGLAHEWLGQGVIVLGTAVVACYWISASVRSQRLRQVD